MMHGLVSRQDGSSKSDGRQFYLKNDLKGHQGAVYAVQYSPSGKFLATGSFDRTVRIWDGTTNQNEVGSRTGCAKINHHRRLFAWHRILKKNLFVDY